ncbi:MAG: DUF5050 domain-containing protein, partial [Ethanoligenens sp.]
IDEMYKIYSVNLQNTAEVKTICTPQYTDGAFQILNGQVFYQIKGGLNRVNLDGSQLTLLDDKAAISSNGLALLGKYLYFINTEDGDLLYRVGQDGVSKQRVS